MSVESGETEPLMAQGPQANYTLDEEQAAGAEQLQEEGYQDLEGGHASTCGVSREFFLSVCGIVLVVIAGFAFTASNVLQKFEVPELTFWQMLMNRALVQTSLMVVICVWKGRGTENHWEMFIGPRDTRKRTVLQGLLGGVLLCCMFVAVKIVPLGNCSAIMFCTPIFTFFLAPCMIREKFGLYRLLISFCMFFGVIFITRPDAIFGIPKNSTLDTPYPMWQPDGYLFKLQPLPVNLEGKNESHRLYSLMVPMEGKKNDKDTSQDVLGYTTCVAVPFLSALISIITRQCNIKRVPVYVLMLWFGIGALIVSIVGPLAFGVQESMLFQLSAREWLIIFSITALGLIGNLSYTLAVKFVSPSLANVFRSFEVILNFVLQVEVEHTAYYSINAVGIVLLLVAVVIMSFEKKVISKFSSRLKWL